MPQSAVNYSNIAHERSRSRLSLDAGGRPVPSGGPASAEDRFVTPCVTQGAAKAVLLAIFPTRRLRNSFCTLRPLRHQHAGAWERGAAALCKVLRCGLVQSSRSVIRDWTQLKGCAQFWIRSFAWQLTEGLQEVAAAQLAWVTVYTLVWGSRGFKWFAGVGLFLAARCGLDRGTSWTQDRIPTIPTQVAGFASILLLITGIRFNFCALQRCSWEELRATRYRRSRRTWALSLAHQNL